MRDDRGVMRKVPRFFWTTEPNGYTDGDGLDQICIDRLTGKVVVRYDLGDPANYNPDYGGLSRSEYLERKKFDPSERMRLSDCQDRSGL